MAPLNVAKEKIDLSLWRSYKSYQVITQYVDGSAAIRQSVTGQAELQYILCNVPTGLSTCQASQVPTVVWVSSPAPSAASGSQIWIFRTEAPTNLS